MENWNVFYRNPKEKLKDLSNDTPVHGQTRDGVAKCWLFFLGYL